MPNKNNSELKREVIKALLDTKAVNFEAVGSVVSKFGSSIAQADTDDPPNICGIWPGHVVRFILLENPGSVLEQVEDLKAVANQLSRTAGALGQG